MSPSEHIKELKIDNTLSLFRSEKIRYLYRT